MAHYFIVECFSIIKSLDVIIYKSWVTLLLTKEKTVTVVITAPVCNSTDITVTAILVKRKVVLITAPVCNF